MKKITLMAAIYLLIQSCASAGSFITYSKGEYTLRGICACLMEMGLSLR